jgi:hypothetical protein
MNGFAHASLDRLLLRGVRPNTAAAIPPQNVAKVARRAKLFSAWAKRIFAAMRPCAIRKNETWSAAFASFTVAGGKISV